MHPFFGGRRRFAEILMWFDGMAWLLGHGLHLIFHHPQWMIGVIAKNMTKNIQKLIYQLYKSLVSWVPKKKTKIFGFRRGSDRKVRSLRRGGPQWRCEQWVPGTWVWKKLLSRNPHWTIFSVFWFEQDRMNIRISLYLDVPGSLDQRLGSVGYNPNISHL